MRTPSPLMHSPARQSPRLAASCRKTGGGVARVTVLNLTAKGCCIDAAKLDLRVGQWINIRFDALESLTAIVRWIAGNLAEIEFERPLHDSVVEHLQRDRSSIRT